MVVGCVVVWVCRIYLWWLVNSWVVLLLFLGKYYV